MHAHFVVEPQPAWIKIEATRSEAMHYLYGYMRDQPRRLVATFSSPQQLLAYVRWATLEEHGPGRGKFEQGSSLAGFDRWESSTEPLNDDDPAAVVHNPSPSML